MNDHDRHVALNVTNFQDDRGLIWADHHGEAISKIPYPERVAVSVKDVFAGEPVLESRGSNDRLIRHNSKITWKAILRQDVSGRWESEWQAKQSQWGE